MRYSFPQRRFGIGMSSPRVSVTPAPQSLRIDISTISRFFRGVSFANYFMLLVCGNAALSTLVTVWSMHSAAEFIGTAIAIAVCLFGTWVGWRNIGVLSAVVHNYTSAALALLCIFFSLLLVSMLPQLFAPTEASYSVVAGAATSLLMALASVAGLLGLFVLHRLSLPGLHVNASAASQATEPCKGICVPRVGHPVAGGYGPDSGRQAAQGNGPTGMAAELGRVRTPSVRAPLSPARLSDSHSLGQEAPGGFSAVVRGRRKTGLSAGG